MIAACIAMTGMGSALQCFYCILHTEAANDSRIGARISFLCRVGVAKGANLRSLKLMAHTRDPYRDVILLWVFLMYSGRGNT